MPADGKWYAGWLRRYYFFSAEEAAKWARLTRHLYHGGILALLAGLAVLVIPPAGSGTVGRWFLVAVAVLGIAGEALWIRSTGEDAGALQELKERLVAKASSRLVGPSSEPEAGDDAEQDGANLAGINGRH